MQLVTEKWFGESPGPRIGIRSNIALMHVERRALSQIDGV